MRQDISCSLGQLGFTRAVKTNKEDKVQPSLLREEKYSTTYVGCSRKNKDAGANLPAGSTSWAVRLSSVHASAAGSERLGKQSGDQINQKQTQHVYNQEPSM